MPTKINVLINANKNKVKKSIIMPLTRAQIAGTKPIVKFQNNEKKKNLNQAIKDFKNKWDTLKKGEMIKKLLQFFTTSVVTHQPFPDLRKFILEPKAEWKQIIKIQNGSYFFFFLN